MQPKLKIETWSIDRVINYARNARLHSDEQVKTIAASITEFGFINPCLVDAEGVLIAGHGRIMACKHLGHATVPVIRLGHLTETQIKALRIADNAIPMAASWSAELLRVELNDLTTAGYDLQLLGFDDVQLVSFLSVPSGADPERTPDPPENPVSRLGDLWICGKHRILCGDSTKAEDVERVLGGKKPNLMVTDPPYGVEYNPSWRDSKVEFARRGSAPEPVKMRGKVANDDRADWREAWQLFGGNVAYVWCASLHSDAALSSLESVGLLRRSHIIWVKPHFQFSRGDYHWMHEPCWYVVRAGRTGHWSGDRKQTTVWDIAGMNPMGRKKGDDAEGNEKSSHGTQKPIECMRRPIQNNSKPGDYVYDPFLGSGTTGVACAMMNRYLLGIEISPIYTDVAVRRIAEFSKTEAILDGDGRTFDQIAKERAKGGQKRASVRSNGKVATKPPKKGKPTSGLSVASGATVVPPASPRKGRVRSPSASPD